MADHISTVQTTSRLLLLLCIDASHQAARHGKAFTSHLVSRYAGEAACRNSCTVQDLRLLGVDFCVAFGIFAVHSRPATHTHSQTHSYIHALPQCHVTSRHVMSCHVTSRHVTSRHHPLDADGPLGPGPVRVQLLQGGVQVVSPLSTGGLVVAVQQQGGLPRGGDGMEWGGGGGVEKTG